MPECRYAHRDYLPLPTEPYVRADYVILPGRLTEYLGFGRAERQEFPEMGAWEWARWEWDVRQRQRDARRDLDRRVYKGEGTLEELGRFCGEDCSEPR
ncbi:hypothetical protein BAUCODRAFT_536625 [Baudoinia panamericana UAMH 10762]|uniref:Uncharacterized protein n=1 Tax=Baudoinia panamericana (strain UAMH 10762) TaxID=717646 RepID=M2N924_BAUPA|nr:uncharacterized protein BAUCODRAFT_536625 [Baudoinia panamericana UAMH 10762]EMC95330.1 hypothetical protein BAUCODRAFT_536625 [Baudoinia panamericana UAMH 10762]